MLIMMLIIITSIMLIFTIAVLNLLHNTNWLRWLFHLVMLSPFLSFAFNFGLSLGIAWFFGEGMVSGAANLIASILFTIYVEVRIKYIPWKFQRRKA